MNEEFAYTEHRERSDEELASTIERLRRTHILLTHDGDADACQCELVDVDADEDIVTAELLEDVDGDPLGVQSTRRPMTGATWRRPRG